MTFENWQVCHFRILGNDKHIPYGSSILEPARRIWRQLTLMEDSMMAYRVVRSSERRVFKIDVGAIPPQDVEQYMEKIVTQLKRHSVVDPNTGQIDLRYNPMSIEEDYFIPVRAGSVTDIQSLAGAQNITAIDDIKYLRDKLFSALKIPQAYLAMGEGATEDKTTLAQKDIRFSRTIQRLQRVIIAELTKIGIIHLYTLGFRGDPRLLNFKRLSTGSRSSTLLRLLPKVISLVVGLWSTSLVWVTKTLSATSVRCIMIASMMLPSKPLPNKQQQPEENLVVLVANSVAN
jgi:hypothetical protein